jgi:hypothetical protein
VSEARKQAEEALRILDDTGENSIYRRHHEARCITALRALLAEQDGALPMSDEDECPCCLTHSCPSFRAYVARTLERGRG